MRRRLLCLALFAALAATPVQGQEWCEAIPDPFPPGLDEYEDALQAPDTAEPIVDLLAMVVPETGPLEEVRGYVEDSVRVLNEVLAKSQVPGTVRLIDVVTAPLSEPLGTDDPVAVITKFAGDPQVQRMRDERQADLVTLVVPRNMLSGFTVGIAYLARSSASGYSVLRLDAVSIPDSSILAHEIGHNLGLPHDKPNALDGGPYAPQAYGHWGQLPDGRWFHDVMSYGSVCPFPGCTVGTRTFSNPEVTYLGAPMGIVGEREAALFLRSDGMRRVAAWRPIVSVPPPPPSVGMITTSQFPNFRFWVRIDASRLGTSVADCLPETVCVAGAIPTRAEVFVRIVGPKPNGYLWPNIVKFNTTKTEVWIQQVSTGITKYYSFPALALDASELPGYVDKTGFLP